MNYLLSVIIPVYNEKKTLLQVIDQIDKITLPFSTEVIIVDDGSTDGSTILIHQLSTDKFSFQIKNAFHPQNKGKGAAIQTGLSLAEGELVLIQDADLEYSPEDWSRVLQPLLEGKADVVYGSRFLSNQKPKPFLNYWANQFLTKLTNLVTGLKLTDMETCYKAFRRNLLQGVKLYSQGFEIEPELTIKLSRIGARFVETPVSYRGRKFDEGKKIRWKDGFSAIFHIFRFRYFDKS